MLWHSKVFVLTHWDQDKMAAILQPTCSSSFSWMKILLNWFHWNLFPRGQLNDCSSFIRHLWQSTKHIKWSSKVVHKNNTIRAYNHTTYITRSYSASQVSCTHVLVVWISSNQFHVSHLWQYCNWCLYMVLPQCQWRRKLGWQAHVLTHGNTQYI